MYKHSLLWLHAVIETNTKTSFYFTVRMWSVPLWRRTCVNIRHIYIVWWAEGWSWNSGNINQKGQQAGNQNNWRLWSWMEYICLTTYQNLKVTDLWYHVRHICVASGVSSVSVQTRCVAGQREQHQHLPLIWSDLCLWFSFSQLVAFINTRLILHWATGASSDAGCFNICLSRRPAVNQAWRRFQHWLHRRSTFSLQHSDTTISIPLFYSPHTHCLSLENVPLKSLILLR